VKTFLTAASALVALLLVVAGQVGAGDYNEYRVSSEVIYVRPWLGATLDDVNDETARSLGLERAAGAVVSDVIKGGPLDEAGIAAGDVILRINGMDVSGADDFLSAIQASNAGSAVLLGINSKGELRDVEVVLGRAPGTPETASGYPYGAVGRMRENESYGRVYLWALERLRLGSAQRRKAATHFAAYRKKTIRLDADIRIAEIELAELLIARPVRLEKVRGKIDEITSKEAELRFFRIKSLEDFKKILTKRQRKRLNKLIQDGAAAGFAGYGRRTAD